MMAKKLTTLHYPITIQSESCDQDLINIAAKVKPQWPADGMKIKVFTEGLTNQLFGVYYNDPDEMILIRIYGEDTELYIDREMEKNIMNFLHQHNCFKPLYCSFNNGICYGYVPGNTLTPDVFTKDPNINLLVSKEFAKIHTLPVPKDFFPEQTRASIFTNFEKLLSLLPEKFEEEETDRRYKEDTPSREELKTKADNIEKYVLENFKLGQQVICHNCLTPQNTILSPEEDKINFIDIEYAGLNYPQFDIACFLNFCIDPVNLTDAYQPTTEQHDTFIRIYLQECQRLKHGNVDVSELDVKKFKDEVQIMKTFSHLYWGTFVILHAYHSKIEYDFLGMAIYFLEKFKEQNSGLF